MDQYNDSQAEDEWEDVASSYGDPSIKANWDALWRDTWQTSGQEISAESYHLASQTGVTANQYGQNVDLIGAWSDNDYRTRVEPRQLHITYPYPTINQPTTLDPHDVQHISGWLEDRNSNNNYEPTTGADSGFFSNTSSSSILQHGSTNSYGSISHGIVSDPSSSVFSETNQPENSYGSSEAGPYFPGSRVSHPVFHYISKSS